MSASWNLTRGPRGWTVLGFQLLSNAAALAGLGLGWQAATAAGGDLGDGLAGEHHPHRRPGFPLAVSAVAGTSLFDQYRRADHLLA